MRILLSNDDGIDAAGLTRLAEAARRLTADVWIVAPMHKWTAASHQLSFDRTLELTRREGHTFACSGAPADCIVAAMTLLFAGGDRPDLVLAGINDGENIGEDAIYSGTLAAAREAALWGISAIAFSRPKQATMGPRDTDIIAGLIERLWQTRSAWSADRALLSINLPLALPAPLVTAHAGTAKIASEVEQISDDGTTLRYRLSRRRRGVPCAGDQASAVADGGVSIVRLSAIGTLPLDGVLVEELARATQA